MAVIGLTGGIASGKSIVTEYLKRYNVDIIDGDEITRQLYAPESPLLRNISAEFGNDILEDDGSLNRRSLRRLVFDDADALKSLNQLVQPVIYKETQQRLNQSPYEHQLLVMPLLLEQGYNSLCDEIWLVYCSEEVQKKRLISRDGIDEDLADKMIASQMPLTEKMSMATVIIPNNSSLIQCRKLIRKYYRIFKKNY